MRLLGGKMILRVHDGVHLMGPAANQYWPPSHAFARVAFGEVSLTKTPQFNELGRYHFTFKSSSAEHGAQHNTGHWMIKSTSPLVPDLRYTSTPSSTFTGAPHPIINTPRDRLTACCLWVPLNLVLLGAEGVMCGAGVKQC